jgi:hypothetical protein
MNAVTSRGSVTVVGGAARLTAAQAGYQLRQRLKDLQLWVGAGGKTSGSLLRPELRRIDCRVSHPVAVIAPGIYTFQGHQALSAGSCQLLQR